MADPSALDVNFIGLQIFIGQLKSIKAIRLDRVLFFCADAHIDPPDAAIKLRRCCMCV